jgi:hypothetical protein
MDPADREMLILAAAGIAVAVVALVLLRKSLAGNGPRFWLGMGTGLGVLTLAIMGAAVWAVERTEREFAHCRAAPTATGCEDANMLMVMVGLASLVSVIVFFIGGFAVRLMTRRKPLSRS